MSKTARFRAQDATVVGAAAQAAIVQRLKRRTMAAGNFSGPCLPALAEHFIAKALKLFDVMDIPLQGAELTAFRTMFRAKLQEGFDVSPHGRFVLAFRPDASDPLAVSCTVSVYIPTLEEQITEWVQTSGADEPFGKHPDAKVLEVGRQLAGGLKSAPLRVLDVGAGTGRNSIPLARLGFAVDAIEPVAQFAARLRKAAEQMHLVVTVIEEDVFEATQLPEGPYELIVLSEVVTHFTEAELRILMTNLVGRMSGNGLLLFNAFVARNGYRPDLLAKQAGSCVWSTLLTQRELAEIARAVELELLSDDSAVEYEKAHLPAEAWPPTPWYVPWATGYNLFSPVTGTPPIELRWLLYRRSRRNGM
jgi:2-polyprenyl-3-methyl-5-hydroxy-6-metoxy-1,4-benzoquinol methylase